LRRLGGVPGQPVQPVWAFFNGFVYMAVSLRAAGHAPAFQGAWLAQPTFSPSLPERHEVPPNGSYRRGVAINEDIFSGEDLVQNKLVQNTIIIKGYDKIIWVFLGNGKVVVVSRRICENTVIRTEVLQNHI
jgi:hypothetical protein